MSAYIVDEFLKRHYMHSSGIPLLRCTGELLRHMRDGLAGNPSSLLMIPTFITVEREIPKNEKVIVMDAGGTNFRIATIHFNDSGAPVIEGFQKYPMPGSNGEMECDEFFKTIAGYIKGFRDASDTVGFCFSFPTEILPNRDGRILNFNKEINIKGAEGRLLGEGINRALTAIGIPEKRFIVLNDTVATMLCGAANQDKTYSGYIGFILGTGTNTCYLENIREITKIGGSHGKMAVNMESGGYDDFPRGDFDRELDARSLFPGDHLMEKMISGGYLGELLTLTIRGAVLDGLFSEYATGHYDMHKTYSMVDISDFMSDSGVLQKDFAREDDRLTLSAIIEDCFERAARIIAVTFAAIMTQTGEGHDPARPVCITAEGTTFLKTPVLRSKLDGYIKSYLNDELRLYCEIVNAEDATLAGTAIAALLN